MSSDMGSVIIAICIRGSEVTRKRSRITAEYRKCGGILSPEDAKEPENMRDTADIWRHVQRQTRSETHTDTETETVTQRALAR